MPPADRDVASHHEAAESAFGPADLANITVLETDGEATRLLDLLDGADLAILIDACVSGALPGTIHRFDASTAPLPETRFSVSTHGPGLAGAIELARTLAQLPPRCIVYAIEGATFDTGEQPSPPVTTAVERACSEIIAELQRL